MDQNANITEPEFRTSHIGLCVRDLSKSLRFYCDGLKFVKITEFDIDYEIPEVDAPCNLTSTFIEKNGLRLELLAYRSPGVIGAPPTRRNHVGFTHLSFIVDDVESAAAALCAHGGQLLPETRMGQDDPSAPQILFVSDPDGNRVEVMHVPGGTLW
ncbi:MAG: VOC family protein [Actinomycetota bacterium]